jgi:hypothetical protein
MENDIIQKCLQEFGFFWLAIYKDETHLSQFGKDNMDNHFEEVKQRFNDLKYFILDDGKKNKAFIVDLVHGLIFSSYQSLQEYLFLEQQKQPIFEFDTKNNIRLIYTKRRRVVFTQAQVKGVVFNYFILGLQWNDNAGNNHKIIYQIDRDGNFVVGA